MKRWRRAPLGLLLLLAGCISTAEAIDHAKTQAAANHGHARDASISQDARLVAAENESAWNEQVRYLGGDE